VITAGTFLIIVLIGMIPINFGALDPLEKALTDFSLTDIVFSRLMNEEIRRADTNMILINIGPLNRSGITQLIENVMQAKPAVVGIDIQFENPGDTVSLQKLISMGIQNKNMFWVYTVLGEGDSAIIKNPLFGMKGRLLPGGHNNFPETDEFRTIRSFEPFRIANKDTIPAFALSIANFVKPGLLQYMSERGEEMETIHYQKRRTSLRMDYPEFLVALNTDSMLLHNKIVLIGYMGQNLDDKYNVEDKFFTPMNDNYAGKAIPDMFGAEIHAQIISMLLNKDFLLKLPEWLEYIFTYIIGLCMIAFCSWTEKKMPVFYDIITKSLQVTGIILLFSLSVIVFNIFRLEIDVTAIAFFTALAADIYSVTNSLIFERE
jgi:CHASE2 domain-containing sensor protein